MDNEKEKIMYMKLLIVEDEENIRKGMSAFLKRYVSEIFTAENGADGLEKYNLYKPDIVLSDIRMPKMTGLEMIKEIKTINEDVYAVIMSAYDDSRYLMEAINSGVNSYVVKPVEREKLLQALRNFYKTKRMKDEMEELKERLDLAIKGNGDGLWDWDIKSDVIYYSDRAKELLGYKNSDTIGIKHEDFMSLTNVEDRDRMDENLRGHFSGNSDFYSCEYRIKTKEGIDKWLLSRGKVVRRGNDNEPLRMVGTFTDINEKKNMEEEIKKNKILKDRIYSIIGHDLRGPIGNTYRFIDMFARSYNRTSEEEKYEYIVEIGKAIGRAYDLLENLLDWTKTQRVEFVPEKKVCSLAAIINETIELLRGTAEGKDINIVFKNEISPEVYADQKMLTTSIRNLLSNAIKFSYRGNKIDISTFEDKGKKIIEIRDYGIGIKQDKVGEIFKPAGDKISEGTGGEKGTGLGLMICKEFIEKNDGILEISSVYGEGTTARIIL